MSVSRSLGPAPWRIRAATDDDAPAVRAVLVAAGVAAWAGFLGAERIEAATAGRAQPADLVAEDDEGVVAFVAWNAASGEIEQLYAHPRAWGSGAASALLARALDALRAAGVRTAWLKTEERNVRARRFYEREGWREEGEPRVRDWHGARLREPRYVKDLFAGPRPAP